MAEAVIGEVPTVAVGEVFPDRKAAMKDGLHRSWGKGIDFDGKSRLSVAIALNEGYEDDVDEGDLILYTGEGGQDGSRRQVRDQNWSGGNLGLRNAHREGVPVRVLRGPRLKSPFRSASGYRYDGLYAVADAWLDTGKSGFLVCRFRLEALETKRWSPGTTSPVARIPGVVLRQVRDTAMARRVKRLHGFRCQICGLLLQLQDGGYAEGAHIIPLGRPHDGPDDTSNLLCLCPNDHVRLDHGALAITDDFEIVDVGSGVVTGRLRTMSGHEVSLDSLRYHRAHIGGVG